MAAREAGQGKGGFKGGYSCECACAWAARLACSPRCGSRHVAQKWVRWGVRSCSKTLKQGAGSCAGGGGATGRREGVARGLPTWLHVVLARRVTCREGEWLAAARPCWHLLGRPLPQVAGMDPQPTPNTYKPGKQSPHARTHKGDKPHPPTPTHLVPAAVHPTPTHLVPAAVVLQELFRADARPPLDAVPAALPRLHAGPGHWLPRLSPALPSLPAPRAGW